MLSITIYTDGSSKGNPGPGGYGVVMLAGPYRKEISEGFRLTTNNRMELLGVCVALEAIKRPGYDVTIYSDSKYVVEAVEKHWVTSWIRKNFKDKKNPDLWIRFMEVYLKHNVRFVWVKGHAQTVENNRCDEMAVAASDNSNLSIDSGYEDGPGSDFYQRLAAMRKRLGMSPSLELDL
ncbi:MAG: ribonuclease HI [Alistipes sp.]|nr:ribonuclease HI [Candidatus Alistipes equi]